MPRGSPGRRINVRLPEADYDNLRTLAYTKHTTVAEVAREILIDGLKAWTIQVRNKSQEAEDASQN